MSDLGASAEHERRKLEQVALAAAELQRAVAVEQRAREVRDLAVRAAVRAGIPPIGFPEPEKKQRARRRSTRRTATSTAAKDAPSPPPERTAEAVRMRRGGASIAHIAEVLGVGKSSVSRALAKVEDDEPNERAG